MNRLPKLSDREVVLLYRAWSEETWAASFMLLPKDGSLPGEFVAWLRQDADSQQRRTDYERDLLRRWRALEEVAEKGDGLDGPRKTTSEEER